MEEKKNFTKDELERVYNSAMGYINQYMNEKIDSCVESENFESAIIFRDTRNKLSRGIDNAFENIGFSILPF